MTRWIAGFAAAALALAPAALAQTGPQTGQPESSATDTKLAPEIFVRKALQSGEQDVSLARLAATQSQHPGVKDFAQIIVADHERVNEQLRLVTQRDAGTERKPAAPGTASPPPTAPGAAPSASPEHKQLSGLSGAAFDKAFMGMMVEGHAKSVELYEQAAQSLPAGAARKLAEDTLPKIKQHLEQARSLQAEVGAEKKAR